MIRLVTPLALVTLLLGGCNFGQTDTVDMSNLKCDASGCLLCEDFTCYQYSCETDFQCPDGYGCTGAKTCMPAGVTQQPPVSGGDPTITTPPPVTDPTDQTPSADPGTTCTISAECGADMMCVNGGCSAGPGVDQPPVNNPVACAGDGDCHSAEFCNAGACQDKSFPLRPEGTCQFNLDCGAAGTCINTRCYFAPAAELGCPVGSAMHDGSGLCLPTTDPANNCQFNAECTGNSLCINATCRAICTVDSECGASTYCGAAGLCVMDDRPVMQCLASADCGQHNSCVDGRCLNSCGAAATCGGEAEMCSFGFCMPTAACFLKAECAESFDCISGACGNLNGIELADPPAADPVDDPAPEDDPAADEGDPAPGDDDPAPPAP